MIKKPYIIAEIGLNYDGDKNIALEMVKKAKIANADAVKFQTFQASKLLNPLAFNEDGSYSKNELFDTFKNYQLSESDHQEIQKLCQILKIDFISSPFDLDSLKIVGKYCDSIKIASSELTNFALLKACGKYQKPVFLSMGMGSLDELKKSIQILQDSGVSEIYPLYCVSLYPLNYEDCNLKVIQKIQQETALTVGFSDHSLGDALPVASIALGALIIEKHVTLKRDNRPFDHSFSMEFDELSLMKEKCQNVFQALGNGIQVVQPKEKEIKKHARRSFFALKNIQKGEALIIDKNIHAVRPVVGIPLEEKSKLQNAFAQKDIKAHFPIFTDDISNTPVGDK